MNRNLHEFDELLRAKIGSSREPLEKTVWENIEKQLDRDDAKLYKRKYKALKRSSFCLLILLLGATFLIVDYTRRMKELSDQKDTHLAQLKQEFTNHKELATQVRIGDIKKAESPYVRALNVNTSTAKHLFSAADDHKKNFVLRNYEGALKSIVEAPILLNKNRVTQEALIESVINPNPLNESDHQNISTQINRKSASVFLDSTNQQPSSLPTLYKKELGIETHNSLVQSEIAFSSHIFVGVFFAPEHGGYNLEDNENNQYDNKEKIQQREKNEFSYSTGFGIGYRINRNWSIESGLSFSSSNISIAKSNIFAEKNIKGDIKFRYNTSFGYSCFLPVFNTTPLIGDSLSTSSSNLVVNYIGLPLSIKYLKAKDRFSWGLGIGTSLNYLTSSSVQTEVQNRQNQEIETITKLEGLRRINLHLIFSAEIDYRISKKIFLSARPNIRYSLNATNIRNVVKAYPYYIGLSAGIFRNL